MALWNFLFHAWLLIVAIGLLFIFGAGAVRLCMRPCAFCGRYRAPWKLARWSSDWGQTLKMRCVPTCAEPEAPPDRIFERARELEAERRSRRPQYYDANALTAADETF